VVVVAVAAVVVVVGGGGAATVIVVFVKQCLYLCRDYEVSFSDDTNILSIPEYMVDKIVRIFSNDVQK
jgi:hypothetical protein